MTTHAVDLSMDPQYAHTRALTRRLQAAHANFDDPWTQELLLAAAEWLTHLQSQLDAVPVCDDVDAGAGVHPTCSTGTQNHLHLEAAGRSCPECDALWDRDYWRGRAENAER